MLHHLLFVRGINTAASPTKTGPMCWVRLRCVLRDDYVLYEAEIEQFTSDRDTEFSSLENMRRRSTENPSQRRLRRWVT